jgi:hypothetical protein
MGVEFVGLVNVEHIRLSYQALQAPVIHIIQQSERGTLPRR